MYNIHKLPTINILVSFVQFQWESINAISIFFLSNGNVCTKYLAIRLGRLKEPTRIAWQIRFIIQWAFGFVLFVDIVDADFHIGTGQIDIWLSLSANFSHYSPVFLEIL